MLPVREGRTHASVCHNQMAPVGRLIKDGSRANAWQEHGALKGDPVSKRGGGPGFALLFDTEMLSYVATVVYP